jgi:ribonuclease BN (tRNA processing enzyme)
MDRFGEKTIMATGIGVVGGGMTELVLLGTAGAPLPVAGRRGISSALVVGDRVFVIDCGRGSPSGYADAGLSFSRLEAVFLTHLHADHIGDLPGMRYGFTGAALQRMAGLPTDVSEVGSVAERAQVREPILSHYLPAEPEAISEAEWAERAGQGFSGTTTAGRDGLRRTLQRMTPSSP